MANIADGVDAVNWCFVIFCSEDFSILSDFNSNFLEADSFGLGASSDGKQDSIEYIFNFVVALFKSDYFSSLWVQCDTDRDGLFDEFNSCFFHVIADFIGDLLIKTSEKDWSHHDSDMRTETMQKSTALQSYIACSDD